ncbi:MAG: HAD family hydrolase [Holophagaceae bacterium]|nr:HAD family hydrolase [Holophagaceae bacterium]
MRNAGRLLVLDVDGVMIDPCGSFEHCVAMGLKEMAPGLDWSSDMFWKFKRMPGFNNDFRLTAAAIALFEAGNMSLLSEPDTTGLPSMEKRINELEPLCAERLQAIYHNVKHLERPLITKPELEAILDWDLAILTGRLPEEVAMAFEVLGFELPFVCDSCTEFRKPKPGGLIHLADTFKATRIFFVGDTRDDATCLRDARKLRPDLDLTFVAVNRLRNEIIQPGDLSFATLRAFLASGKLGCTNS